MDGPHKGGVRAVAVIEGTRDAQRPLHKQKKAVIPLVTILLMFVICQTAMLLNAFAGSAIDGAALVTMLGTIGASGVSKTWAIANHDKTVKVAQAAYPHEEEP